LIDGDKLGDTGDADGLTYSSANTRDCLSADGNVHFVCCTDDGHTNDGKNGSKDCRVSSSDEIRDGTGERGHRCKTERMDQCEPCLDAGTTDILSRVF
jgi:hypothetical protein